MYKLCVFAGTSEGRQLVKWLASFEGLSVTACAATEYGGELLEEIPGVIVSAKRLDEGQMEALPGPDICAFCGTGDCRRTASV